MVKSIKGISLLSVIGFCLIVSVSSGCALVENPSVDELFGQERVLTPSAKAALAIDTSPVSRERGFTTTVRHIAQGQVTHGALYFQDGFEETSTDDGRFNWSIEDQLAFPMGVARYLMNAGAMPISVLVTPPGAVMLSDGRTATPYKSERS